MICCRVASSAHALRASVVICCLVVLATLAPVRGDQTTPAPWAQWRGPSGQGYSDDTRVPLVWNETTNLLWKTSLPGRGNSTPIVWGEHIFLTASSKDGTQRMVLCVNRADGTIRWQRIASKGMAPGKTHAWNGYASASCTTDGERVYAFFGTPGLFCYDLDGKLLWQHSFGVFTSETGWGTAASPMLFEDLVIQNCDNDGARALPPGHSPKEAAPMALVALDKRTGNVRWQTPRNQGRGFSTPRLITTPAGRLDLVLNGPLGVWAYDPRTGKEIWHCARSDAKDNARFGEPVPVSSADMLFAPSGRPGPFQAIGLDGTGNVTKTQLRWQVSRRGHRDVSSQILWKGLLYAADNKGVLTCYDARSGKVLYNERLSGGGKSLASPVAVRDRLLFVLDTGETVVIEPGPQLKVAGRNVLGEGNGLDFAASPAIADGRLYLRSQSYLYCIGEKGR
jgi:outer membrane protein assembly factor BamB